MRYFLIERQSGGCDYTIGCGLRVRELKAASVEEAREVANEMIGTDWQGEYEMAVTKAELLVVQETEDLAPFLNAKAAERAEVKRRKAEAAQEAQERAAYERLKGKFG
jgi:hypothetical protein